MNRICAKIYYELSTGEVLTITSECQGSVEEATKEQDINIYSELQGKSIDEIDYIELEYGTLATTFNNIKSYSVNLKTKILNTTYYTQEEIETMIQEKQETRDLNSRVSDITEYLSNSDDTTIADIENSILQKELNNFNGGM